MKKFIIALLILFLGATTVLAQENSSDSASKYGVTFPIAELGGCVNITQCRTYCEDPLNQVVCEAYAKSKGFYKEDALSARQQELLAIAKTELGCSDRNSCQAVCHLEENFDKCSSFAQRNGIQGGHIQDPARQEIIEKAKALLGCDSPTSCKAICEQEQNRDKCDNFAKEAGLRGGTVTRGPGGCTSSQTCEAYCKDPNHFQDCSQFVQTQGGQQQSFTGPGGCNSEESCRRFCTENPNKCHFTEQGSQKREEVEQCFRSGKYWWSSDNSCHDKAMANQMGIYPTGGADSQRRAEEYADYCRKNPDKCQPGQSGGFSNEQDRAKYEEECRKNPEKCRFSPNTPPGPSGYYQNTTPYPSGSYNNYNPNPNPNYNSCPSGQYWNGTSCQSSPNYSPNTSTDQKNPAPTATSQVQPQQESPEQACSHAPGCHWESNSCQCSTQSSGSTGSGGGSCESHGGHWENGQCVGAVQGVTTELSWWDKIIGFLQSLFR